MTEEQRLAVYRACPLFASMSAETEKTLLALPTERIPSGQSLGLVPDKASSMRLGIILAGKATITGKSEGGHVLLNRLGRGDVFGAAGVFCPGPERMSTVTALTACELLYLGRTALEDILQSDFAVARAYIEFLSGKILFLNRKILAFTAPRSDAALAGYLLAHADAAGRVKESRAQLSAVLAVGRTTLYRALDALVLCGAVRTEGKEIVILDRAALVERAK